MLLLPLILILGAGPSWVLADPCKALVAAPSYDLAKQCISSIPFHAEVFDATLDNLRKTLPLIVFQDIAKHPPPTPFYQEPIDLEARVAEIQRNKPKYTSDLAWNEELYRLMQSMNDAHLVYEVGCFRRFKYMQPFFPVAIVEPHPSPTRCTQKNVRHIPCTPGFKTTIVVGALPETSVQYKKHLGRVIEAIDGMPAVDCLWRFAQTRVGKYKDPMSRFNYVVAQQDWEDGKWVTKGGSFAVRTNLPENPTVKYTLAATDSMPQEVLEIPWEVSMSKTNTFADGQEYWSKMCLSDVDKKAKKKKPTSERMAGVEDNVDAVDESHIKATAGKRVMLDTAAKHRNFRFWKKKEKQRASPGFNADQQDARERSRLVAKEARHAKRQAVKNKVKKAVNSFLTPLLGSFRQAVGNVVETLRFFKSTVDPNNVVLKDFRDVLRGKRKFVNLPAYADASLFHNVTSQQPVLRSKGLAFFRLEKAPHVGVLKVTTFGGFTNLTLQNEWRQAVFNMLTHQLDGKPITKLLIDLSNNGGGEPCLAQELTSVLVAKYRDPNAPFTSLPNNFPKDMRISPLLQQLMKTAVGLGEQANSSSFYPGNYRHIDTRQVYEGLDILKPQVRKVGKHGQAQYTQLFVERCRSPQDNPLRKLRLALDIRKDVAMVSNGMCGSACGRLYFYLHEMFNVPTVVAGSFATVPRTASAFPATTVYDYEDYLAQIETLNLHQDATHFPGPFPLVTNFRFPVRESLSRKFQGQPLEYVFEPAEYHVDYNKQTALRPDAVWTQASALLKWN